MKKDLAGIRLTPGGFAELARLCRNDPKFPTGYLAWQELLDLAYVEAVAAARPTTPVELDPMEFSDWCALVGIVPCLEALRAFVIIKRNQAAAGDAHLPPQSEAATPLSS